MCVASKVGPGVCGVLCCGGGVPCPISRREYKRDIEYLDPPDLARAYEELRRIRLATYQYKDEPEASPRRLGFIIDDAPASACVSPDGRTVDLYGYLSMAVAAVQVQAREIDKLRVEIQELKRSSRRAPGKREGRQPTAR
jgi:hypothetical protein